MQRIFISVRAATAGKAGKDWSFPRFWDTLTLSQPGGGKLGPPYSIGPSLAQTCRGGPECYTFKASLKSSCIVRRPLKACSSYKFETVGANCSAEEDICGCQACKASPATEFEKDVLNFEYLLLFSSGRRT
jgi:hypothetical protein